MAIEATLVLREDIQTLRSTISIKDSIFERVASVLELRADLVMVK